MRMPGSWLVQISARFLDRAAVESLVAPTIADLQYEVSEAGSDGWRLRLAQLRGYIAVARLVFATSVFWRSPMRRLLTVLSLGWVGAALFYLLIIRHTSGGPSRLTPFLLMAIATPVVLRQMNLASTFRAAFTNCLGVGLIMGTALYSWVIWDVSASGSKPLPWYALVLSYAFLLACIAVGSALAAAAASKAPANANRLQRTLRHVAAGCLAYALFDGVVRLWSGFPVISALGWAFFLAFYFGCVCLLVHVPILVGARHLMPQRVSLTLIGALLCPIPLLAFPALQGRPLTLWTYWLQHPTSLVWGALPYLVGGAVLGWLVATRSTPADTSTP